MKNNWSILGLQPGASFTEIKQKYLRLRSKTHPDKGGKEEDFKRLKEAYTWLQDHWNDKIEDEAEVILSTLSDEYQDKIYPKRKKEKQEQKKSEPIKKQNRKTGFCGFLSDGSIGYAFPLSAVLLGGSVEIANIPSYARQVIDIPAKLMPGSKISVKLKPDTNAYWVNEQKSVYITIGVETNDTFTIQENNLICELDINYEDLLQRKTITINHPSYIYPLSGNPSQLIVPLPKSLYNTKYPIVIPGLGFYDKDGKVGNLKVYIYAVFPEL
jgi:DnaJ-class molecular chaperone